MNGNILDKYQKRNRLDLFHSISYANSGYMPAMCIYLEELFRLYKYPTGSIKNRIDIIKDFGTGEKVGSFDINEEVIDFTVIDNKIYMFHKNGISYVSFSRNTTTGMYNISGTINKITNTSPYEYELVNQLRIVNDFIYYSTYQHIILVNTITNTTKVLYTASYFISGFEIIPESNNIDFTIFIGLELKDSFNINIIKSVDNSIVEKVSLSQTDYNDKILSTNNFMIYDSDKSTLYVSSYSGNIYSFKYANNNLTNKTWLANVRNNIDKVVLVKNYIILMDSMNQLVLINTKRNIIENIQLDNYPENIVATNLFVIVNNSSRDTTFYKLEYLPDLSIDYTWIEKRSFNNSTNSKFFLNVHVNLMHSLDIVDKSNYNVSLNYRSNSISRIFPEANQSANMYIPFDDKETVLSELMLPLGNDMIRYTVLNEDLDVRYSNKNIQATPEDIIYKILYKNAYYLNGSIYFRLRYLLSSEYIMTITIDGKTIIINNFKRIEDYYKLTVKIKNMIFSSSESNDDVSSYLINIIGNDNYQRVYYKPDDLPELEEKYYRLQIDELNFTPNKDITFSIFNTNSEQLIETKTFQMDIDPRNVTDILYKNTDNDIRMIEKSLVNELEQGNKTLFIETMGHNSFETKLDNSKIKVTKDPFINNFINDESQYGYIDFTSEYGSYEKKQNSLISDIFINGKHIFRKSIKQQDSLDGKIYAYMPSRFIKEYIDVNDANDVLDGNSSLQDKYEVIVSGNKRKIVESEKTIKTHIIDNTFEDQTNMLGTTGILLTDVALPTGITPSQLRVFIKKKTWNFFRRINPYNYYIKIEPEYNTVRLIVYGSSYMDEGTEIHLLTSGTNSGSLYYNQLDLNEYDIDCLPFATLDDDSNIFTNINSNPEDIDINIDGLTLYPGIDYTIIDPDFESIPSLIVFKSIVPKTSTIEINLLNENSNYIRTFSKPAEGTTDVFSLDDDSVIFIKGTFTVYVNNLRIDSSKVKILNGKSIQIIDYADPLINVMIRFSYDDHTQLKLILDWYKYDKMNLNDNYYHSYYNVRQTSNFDILTGITNDNSRGSIRKLILMDYMRQRGKTIINCNNNDLLSWDISLDSEEINNKYISQNIILDMNPQKIYDPEADIIDPII
ncbi:hypothetical protein FPHOBKDP_00215 [Listeria phage LPJP1]|nr:hypothetical protein FPHOBKDP_00215 [Listeria phage LPJP1]